MRTTRLFLPFLVVVGLLWAAATDAQTPEPVRLPDGESVLACANGQTPTLVPPDRANCPLPTATPTATATPTSGFRETFDGQPATPQPWRPDSGWDVTVHSRDRETWVLMDSVAAQHGTECQPPPEAHIVNTYEEAVFRCRDHIMTSINARGYGVIYLTPAQLVDFSDGEAVIRFDVSTLRTSNRDWIDLWITPYDDNLQTPLEDWLPDLNGEPRRAIHVRMKFGQSGNLSVVFQGFVVNGFDSLQLSQARTTSYEPQSALSRQMFELRISQNRLRFGMPAHNLWWLDAPLALDWDRGVVQFGHHSYNPLKDCPLSCSPGTWHWDNVSIEPAIPFTILRADRRFVDPTSPGPLSFPAPAPSNAHLRFSGIGNGFRISTDGGATWVPAQLQAQEEYHSDHFRSYWTPIPAGTTTVHVDCQNWWGGRCHARDISIWSLEVE